MRDERANTITTEINYGRFAVERFTGYLRTSRRPKNGEITRDLQRMYVLAVTCAED